MKFRDIISYAGFLTMTVSCVSLRDEFKTEDYVKNRAAYDFDCRKENVEVSELASKTFSATGCGKKAIYSCKYTGPWYENPKLECAAEKTPH